MSKAAGVVTVVFHRHGHAEQSERSQLFEQVVRDAAGFFHFLPAGFDFLRVKSRAMDWSIFCFSLSVKSIMRLLTLWRYLSYSITGKKGSKGKEIPSSKFQIPNKKK